MQNFFEAPPETVAIELFETKVKSEKSQKAYTYQVRFQGHSPQNLVWLKMVIRRNCYRQIIFGEEAYCINGIHGIHDINQYAFSLKKPIYLKVSVNDKEQMENVTVSKTNLQKLHYQKMPGVKVPVFSRNAVAVNPAFAEFGTAFLKSSPEVRFSLFEQLGKKTTDQKYSFFNLGLDELAKKYSVPYDGQGTPLETFVLWEAPIYVFWVCHEIHKKLQPEDFFRFFLASMQFERDLKNSGGYRRTSTGIYISPLAWLNRLARKEALLKLFNQGEK